MKLSKKTLGRAQKILNTFVVLMMLIQPVGSPGILKTLAADEPMAEAVSVLAPDSEPATDPALVVDPIPTADPAGIIDPGADYTEAPAVSPQDPAAIVEEIPAAETLATPVSINEETGDLNTIIVDNVKAKSLDLDSIDPENVEETAKLATDKADYAPTDTAIIFGTGFIPNQDYTLIISSKDVPPVTKNVTVTADENGQFVYAYQLDGTYRPDYKVEAKNDSGDVVAEVTFTDSVSECGTMTCILSFGGICQAWAPASSTPGVACTSDNDACTADICGEIMGQCTHNSINCNDGDPNTIDGCNPASGCTHLFNPVPGVIDCPDGNACTTDTFTGSGLSCEIINPAPPETFPRYPITCDDGNALTTDTCNPSTGCVYTPVSQTCDDNNACTGNDVSLDGGTCAGQLVSCDDNNAGTTDSCNPTSGCVFTLNGLDTDGDGMADDTDTDDDNDGVADSLDVDDLNPRACGDTDLAGAGDNCDDCSQNPTSSSTSNDPAWPEYVPSPFNDGVDIDGDGLCTAGDIDNDNDGVNDGPDTSNDDPSICRDIDNDTCNDCSQNPTSSVSPTPWMLYVPNTANDGIDSDSDGLCDIGDNDEDNDGYLDTTDCNDADSTIHPGAAEMEADGIDQDCDGAELCYVDADNDGYRPDDSSTVFSADLNCFGLGEADDAMPLNDCNDDSDSVHPGAFDIAGDSIDQDCDGSDTIPDSDGDGVSDVSDNCSSVPNLGQENNDGDAQGDACDTDDDNDSILDGPDESDLNPRVCGDTEDGGAGDQCDDCSQNPTSSSSFNDPSWPVYVPSMSNDGMDTDGDELCNLGDGDDDNDGVNDGPDTAELNPDICIDNDNDTCDDCSVGTDDLGPLSDFSPSNDGIDVDSDGMCDAGDPQICGNGDIETGEQCDDGNIQGGDGCSDTCQIEKGSILVHKFHDKNIDGVKNGADSNYTFGVFVELFSGDNCQGTRSASGTTNNSGNYSFANLLPGNYSVKETVPTGWKNSTSTCQNVAVSSNNQSPVNFGNYRLGQINVCKYDDSNEDGSQVGESTMSGWTINLASPNGYNNSLVTDVTGCVGFSNLEYGTYTYSEVMQTGWVESVPAGGRTYAYTVNADNYLKNFHITNYQKELNLSVTKTDLSDPVYVGQNITYTINWSVTGNTQANNLFLHDFPFFPLELVLADNLGWEVYGSGYKYSLGSPNTPASGSVTVVLKVPSDYTGSNVNNDVKLVVDDPANPGQTKWVEASQPTDVQFCGDEITNGVEQCDDGNSNNTDACTNSCTIATCGDGIVNGSEECDGGDNCSATCQTEILPVCGDGIKNGDEQCDGTDGTNSGQNFCSTSCSLVKIYNGADECPAGTVKSVEPVISETISANDANGESFDLTSGGKYLFEASGTFSPTTASGYESDAGYTKVNENLSSQYGIQGTGDDYAAHALLADLGEGVGVVDWGGYNSDHIYTKYYEPSSDDVQFVIGDRYGDWFDTDYQNQSGTNDNSGSLNLDVYECINPPVVVDAKKVVCDNESDLPNWGGGGHSIGVNTAQDYVDAHPNCHLENQWAFQWAPAGGGSFGAFQTDTSSLDNPWNTFTAISPAEVSDISNLGGRIEVRELFPTNSGQWIGFSNDNNNNFSSEIYCTGDAANYDNWEWINNPQAGQTYYCVAFNALLDNTAPTVPTGIYYKDTENDKDVLCGQSTSARNFDVYWDANTETDFDHYEYISFNADGSTGPIRIFTEPYFDASWWTVPTEGTYGVQIRAVDKTGNKSEWFGGSQGVENSCQYTADWTAPTVDLIFPTPGPSAKSFQAVFSEDVKKDEAENPANYFLNNWPGAGGSGDLAGDVTISYDFGLKIATVNFTASGWYVSPEQQWGVQNIHDLAGNLQSVNPYTEYSTPMVVPTLSANPPAGDYTADQLVELSGSDSGSGIKSIYYTLDGSTPDDATGTPYAGAITVDHDMTIKAIAYDNAGNASDVLEAAYEIAPKISEETSLSATETSVIITWLTDDPATSRVIYDIVPHPVLGSVPDYGYANSTVEDVAKVTDHSVGLTGLVAGTIYYYRVISHGSPETVGAEQSFTTAETPSSDNDNPDSVKKFQAKYRSATKDVRLTWKVGDSDTEKVYIYRGKSKSFAINSSSRITVQNKGDSSYTDRNITLGKTYYYKAVARDAAGNNSSAKIIKIIIPANERRSALSTNQGTEVVPAGTILGAETSKVEEENINENKNTENGQILGEQAQADSQQKQGGISWWMWLLGLLILLGIFFWGKKKFGKNF